MSLNLKNPKSCDGCENLQQLATLGQHRRCNKYKFVMTPQDDVMMMTEKAGRIKRPQACIDTEEKQ